MVYFIRCYVGDKATDIYKIGYTRDHGSLQTRLRSLQSGCPYDLRVVAQVPGTPYMEQCFHDQLKHRKIRGEWFKLTAWDFMVEPILSIYYFPHVVLGATDAPQDEGLCCNPAYCESFDRCMTLRGEIAP